MKIITNLIILLLACAATHMGTTLYFKETASPTPASKSVKEVSIGGREALILAAAIDKLYKDTHLRDTVIVQQVLKIQHELKMHKNKLPLCPACMSTHARTAKEYYTKDGFK